MPLSIEKKLNDFHNALKTVIATLDIKALKSMQTELQTMINELQEAEKKVFRVCIVVERTEEDNDCWVVDTYTISVDGKEQFSVATDDLETHADRVRGIIEPIEFKEMLVRVEDQRLSDHLDIKTHVITKEKYLSGFLRSIHDIRGILH